MFQNQLKEVRQTANLEKLPDLIAEMEIVVSGIEDVAAVEQFYDFALEELKYMKSYSEDLEECVLVDDDSDEFDSEVDAEDDADEEEEPKPERDPDRVLDPDGV